MSFVGILPKHMLFVFILVSLWLCLNVSVCFSLFILDCFALCDVGAFDQ